MADLRSPQPYRFGPSRFLRQRGRTSNFKPLAILGGAFGFGLKSNVIDTYKFVCRNYKFAAGYAQVAGTGALEADYSDDDLFGFGFSRGAFTIRVVVGLLLDQGILKAANEADLDAKATETYRNYRARHFKTITGVEQIFRFLRDRKKAYTTVPGSKPLKHIRFLGLWDTVAAYGLPVDEMTRGVSRYLWPLELPAVESLRGEACLPCAFHRRSTNDVSPDLVG